MNLADTLADQQKYLAALDTAQRESDEATAAVKATQAALSDLEDDANVEALESGATNAEGRKAAAHRWLKTCKPYQDLKVQLAEQQREQRQKQADRDDAERNLKACERRLPALVAQFERETAEIASAGYARYAQGSIDYRRAAETQAAARGVASGR